jgi:spore germination cell wall hydrolase CwlJ-like protein
MTIIGEAASEPYEGQVAVGRVIRNRMARKYSSDGTVIGTVLRPKQFSMWDDKARLYAANIELDSETYKVAAAAWVDSGKNLELPAAVLYHTTAVHPSWKDASTVKKIATIGDHIFYTDEGGGI